MKTKVYTYFFKIFDKLILGILFSSLFLSSCTDEPQPSPEYGVVPLYGIPTAQVAEQASLGE